MRRATIILIAGTAVIWIGWDVVLGVGGHATESMIIASWARRVNALPFVLGALVAHWCWQSRRPRYELWPWAVVAVGVVGVWDLGWWFAAPDATPWMRHPGVWMGLGLPAGHFLWPQRYPT